MTRESANVRRQIWGYDPSYDRCEAFDDDGNHLGITWFEEREMLAARPIQDKMNRRTWLTNSAAALIAMIFQIIANPQE